MKVLIVNTGQIPVTHYGGTERVIWYLGKELCALGHTVDYLVNEGSSCTFGKVHFIDYSKPIVEQIPNGYDIIHFNFIPENTEKLKTPHIITVHGNSNERKPLDKNCVFVSQNHASRFNSESFVHNGLDWNDYMVPDFTLKRNYFHFLGNAAWRVKNVKGAIATVTGTKREKLKVLGGQRFNFKMGIRLTTSPRASFYGMVGGEHKFKLLNGSKGLIFPVRWHEPFGLAIIESLYYGCPVFGTPYGSLPELVTNDVGYLSNSQMELSHAIERSDTYKPETCHEYAKSKFNSKSMAKKYLEKYEIILAGRPLNKKVPMLKQVQQEKFLPWD